MANSDRLAEVCALLAERNEDFREIKDAATGYDEDSGESFWALSYLREALEIQNDRRVIVALNRAKVSADKAGMPIRDHFRRGELFDDEGEVYLSKYAAHLVVMNCDPREGHVGLAQVYFALQIDRQQLEDEKRLKTRLDVATEQNKLQGVAKEKGVSDFSKFNGMGIQGLYGGYTATELRRMKKIKPKANHLDYAGSEELAANLFRITQTRAALHRQERRSEHQACSTHKKVAEGVRNAILDAGNTPPEKLPAAELNIDRLTTQVKKRLA